MRLEGIVLATFILLTYGVGALRDAADDLTHGAASELVSAACQAVSKP